MKIREAIERVDSVKPNAYSNSDKTMWLSELDGRILKEVILTHDGAEEESTYAKVLSGYSYINDSEESLLVSAPYSDIYIKWLTMQIDYANADINRYNNSLSAFERSYSDFVNYYNRTHIPKTKARFELGN